MKNKEQTKKKCYVAGEVCGTISKIAVGVAVTFFTIGTCFELAWDIIERREAKNRVSNKNNNKH